ncbi:hypothetical protein CCM_01491 [Cordyceps militaris CM01]|uniref:IDI-2 n=2 Tax=Cordyceps militaris TaxID=73501 RepID=G3J5C3_CORMM|nr:uncharacterized protein CCM_01491 [Cordyceps militaris CM01]ATY64232.1 hypothetical protein A9K55_004844 [Cordyceps militaris]EGX96833.1 hypothetical protein CCM_01491 [Cordyceps militaris CM01]
MRSTIAILLQAASLATALSAVDMAHVNGLTRGDVTHTEAAALCGDLGVMEVPVGMDPYTVRACKEHPSSLETEALTLEKRKCWYGPPSGCSRQHWCYRSCDNGGQGSWCWTTVGSPLGAWKSCGRDEDCSPSDPCSGGGCKKCGCGC